MKRNTYDLSHLSFEVGEIGRLQTLSVIPVVAGDSFTLDLEGIFRLSPLRRDLTMDCKVDLFVFYVPHRHIYGDKWTDFMKQGNDEDVTLGTDTLRSGVNFLGCSDLRGTIPKWLLGGYWRIWNRYFRVPTDTASVVTHDNGATTGNALSTNESLFGKLCARLKTYFSTGVSVTTDADERTVGVGSVTVTPEVPGVPERKIYGRGGVTIIPAIPAIPAVVTAAGVDILELERVKAHYKTEVERDYFAQRYSDVMKGTFGAGVGTDADERPTLCAKGGGWLSGYDVDGSADANLGQFAGKSIGKLGLRMPRKFFNEHGTLWVMALPRFSTVSDRERHYLYSKAEPTYKEIAGDPDLLMAEPPHEVMALELLSQSTNQSLGTFPYAQWYRTHPNNVHVKYRDINGFPFLRSDLTSLTQSRYHVNGEYNHMFQTTQLGHWRSSCRINLMAQRVIPTARQSIFAGTK